MHHVYMYTYIYNHRIIESFKLEVVFKGHLVGFLGCEGTLLACVQLLIH